MLNWPYALRYNHYLTERFIDISKFIFHCGCLFQRGFNLENILVDEHGNVDGEMKYYPLEDPLNNQSMPVTVNLTKYTGNVFQILLWH